jgi:hypothetical protein
MYAETGGSGSPAGSPNAKAARESAGAEALLRKCRSISKDSLESPCRAASKEGSPSGAVFRLYLYDPAVEERRADGLYDHDRPAFVMWRDDAGSEWWLVQWQCDLCRNTPGLTPSCICHQKTESSLSLRHRLRVVGEAPCHYMEAKIRMEEGGAADPLPGPGPRPRLTCNRREKTLVMRMPKWNNAEQSLVLPCTKLLDGQKLLDSAKNLQLTLKENPRRVVCQYGKVGPNSFVLDFTYPLTLAQAFGIVLSTVFWH